MPSSSAGSTGLILSSAFLAPALLANTHVQTLASQLRPPPPLQLMIERLDTPDGDFIDVAWAGDRSGGAPIVLLLHGLGGGFDSKYLRGLARRLIARGWCCGLLQFRGGGPQANRLPRCYHQGDTGDLRWLWRRLRVAEPDRFMAAVGWSMGGNILLRALAEEGAACPLQEAFAVSVPFSLLACAEHLDRGFARLYQQHLLNDLKVLVRRKQANGSLGDAIDLQRVSAARNFIDFDNAFTAPLNGFRDADDYYRRCASGTILGDIRTPTRIIHALDDPFMPSSVVPSAAALSSSITLELSKQGGHVGFWGNAGDGRPQWWLESHLSHLLEASFSSLR